MSGLAPSHALLLSLWHTLSSSSSSSSSLSLSSSSSRSAPSTLAELPPSSLPDPCTPENAPFERWTSE
eukprot:CAMPEP_0182476426 /NCGR_PEP_ID=MMETSP1319-20130603/29063_1 /TAXON_ID=172717 /ORGANISM="Bolidomonas pacifica, Strain RCC208" /LENGTH=67 /DNA_ID=CAMNT_0024677513 /DNA_START=107 /DNA_END=307 /DNA_ORIENTATION=+